MPKIACMTLLYNRFSFERSLQGIAKAGYQYVAFGLPHEGVEVPEHDDEHTANKLRQLFERYELQPIMLVSTNQLAPGQSLERVKQRIQFAKYLDIPELLSLGTFSFRNFPNNPYSEQEMQQKNQAFVEQFQRLAKEAEAAGLTVSIKPHTGNTATAVELNETLDKIGSPFVKASYDPGNVHFYEGVDPAADIRLIAGRVSSLIAKDHRGARANKDFPVPGEGDVRFLEIFEILYQAGFKGPLIVERIDGKDGKAMEAHEIDRHIHKARINLEQMLSRAGIRMD